MTDIISRAYLIALKNIKNRTEKITYKAPNFGVTAGEVISGQLGRGEGGRFANIEDLRRASQSENPTEVFQGSKRRMFQSFYNSFTRETPFTKDLDASQKKVADLLASKNGNWDDEVKQAQQLSDELWQLDTAYRRNMLTGNTGIKPKGVSVKIEGLNSSKTGDGKTVAEMIQENTGEPADSFAKGIGQRMVQDAYNYLSMFNQRSELKKLNGVVPEFNLTRLADGQKYKINEEELANGKIKIDFNYDPNQPQGPSKDDITAAMSDIMMKLDPEIVKYAELFSAANPNFAIGKDRMPKDLLQQAMASLLNDPQKMSLENPDLFKFALSALQGVDLFTTSEEIQTPQTPPSTYSASDPYAAARDRSQAANEQRSQGGKIQPNTTTQSSPYNANAAARDRRQAANEQLSQGGKIQPNTTTQSSPKVSPTTSTQSNPYAGEIARSQAGQGTSTQSNPYAGEIARSQAGQNPVQSRPNPYAGEIARGQAGQNPVQNRPNPYEDEISRGQAGQGTSTRPNPYAGEIARGQAGQNPVQNRPNPYEDEISRGQTGQRTAYPQNRAAQFEPMNSTQSNPYAGEIARGQAGQGTSTRPNPYAGEIARGQAGQNPVQNRPNPYEDEISRGQAGQGTSTRPNPYAGEIARGQAGQNPVQNRPNPYEDEISRGQTGQRTAYPQNRAAQFEPMNSTQSNPYAGEIARGQAGQGTSTRPNPYAGEIARGQAGQGTSTRPNPNAGEIARSQAGQNPVQSRPNPYRGEIARGQAGQNPIQSRPNPNAGEIARSQAGQRTAYPQNRAAQFESANGNNQEQALANRANNILQGIPGPQQPYLMRDIISNPEYAAEKYGISVNDAYMLSGYYRQFGGR